MDAPRSGMVKLVPSSGSALTLIKAGDFDRTGAVGGWETQERALQEDASWWRKRPLAAGSLPCIIDLREIGGPALERRLDVLYQMGQSTEDEDPPSIRMLGDVDPDSKRRGWKIDDIQLGKQVFHPDNPTLLLQQHLTISLSEFVAAKAVSAVSVRRTRTGGKTRRRTIRTKRGDTLRAIAVRQLGTSGAYKQIREWNPRLRRVDPDQPLKVNTLVVLR